MTVFNRGFRLSHTLGKNKSISRDNLWKQFKINSDLCVLVFKGESSKTVVVPPFADSISEGDVRWDKGKS